MLEGEICCRIFDLFLFLWQELHVCHLLAEVLPEEQELPFQEQVRQEIIFLLTLMNM